MSFVFSENLYCIFTSPFYDKRKENHKRGSVLFTLGIAVPYRYLIDVHSFIQTDIYFHTS